MVSNSRMHLVIGIVFVVLTIASLHVAMTYNFWNEFIVTEVLLIVSSVAVALLLRAPENNPEQKKR